MTRLQHKLNKSLRKQKNKKNKLKCKIQFLMSITQMTFLKYPPYKIDNKVSTIKIHLITTKNQFQNKTKF